MFIRTILLVVAIAGCQLEDEPHDRSAETGEKADEAWHETADVTQLDDTHFQITRALWDALPTLAETEPGIRVVPTSRDGRLYGGKLFVIKPGSLPERLGFQNGDVVRAINGQLVLNPEDAFNAYFESFDAQIPERPAVDEAGMVNLADVLRPGVLHVLGIDVAQRGLRVEEPAPHPRIGSSGHSAAKRTQGA